MTSDHWQQTRAIHKEYAFFYQIIGGILLIVLAALLGRTLFPSDEGYWSNFYMTLLGVLITILVLDRLAERRESLREEKALKERLIREMGSRVNEVATRATEELEARGWIEAGILYNVDLRHANLKSVKLWGANLEKSILQATNLEGVNLGDANLRDALLRTANLKAADLRWANLQGVDFTNADLENAKLINALFNADTTLPNGNGWTPDTDMTRFTDPSHPNFWRSDNPGSPAYRGKPNP